MEPRGRFLGRNTLVVAQVAGSLFLLICATQLYRGISLALAKPPAFRPDHILMASFDPTVARYSEAQTQSFYERLTERAQQLPGAVSACVAELVPMSNDADRQPIVPEGYQLSAGTESVRVFTNIVGGDYFSTVDIPILRGRAFRPSDTAESPRVAVINEHLAQTFFPRQDPIGKRFRLPGASGPWVEIVGLARQSNYQMLIEQPEDALYLPLTQNHRNELTLLVHTAGPSEALAAPLRELVSSLDADQPMFGLRTMEEYFRDRATKLLALLASFVGGMGLLGLILALAGIYAVMAWSVTRRQREIGIRMAVGADRVTVLGMILKQGFRLSATGVVIGLALSLAFGRALTAGTGAPSLNVPLLAAVTLGLLTLAAAGAYVPARRASKLDPITVLRQE
jgi:predicted permease